MLLGLAALIATVSITAILSFKKDTSRFSVEKYSGLDLFNALIFIRGDHLVQNIPDCNEIQSFFSSAYTKAQINHFYLNEDRIISIIKSKHPNFFKNFKVDIMSGDPLKIDSALIKADALIRLYSNNEKLSDGFPAVGTEVIDFDIVTMANAPATPESYVVEEVAGATSLLSRLNREEYANQIAMTIRKNE